MDEIRDALSIFKEYDKKDIILLHCNTEYPTPFRDVNLSAMKTLKDYFDVQVGYSDHTVGIEIPIAAAAMGACVIEKHFTLDRNLPGPDHKASLEPSELLSMVEAIRNVEIGLGDGVKKPSASEYKNLAIARKSIVAKKDIRKGEVFTQENLTAKRPGDGISPMRWDEVIGATAGRNYYRDEKIDIDVVTEKNNMEG